MRKMKISKILLLALVMGFIILYGANTGSAATKKKISLTVGQTKKVTKYAPKNSTYKSKNKKIATVTKKGVIKAKKKGSCIIVAKSATKKVTFRVTVTKKAKLNETELSIKVADAKQLNFSLGNTKAKWSSKNKKIATVSKKGLVKAISEGTTYIKAKYKGRTYQCKVTVEQRKIVGGYTIEPLYGVVQSVVAQGANYDIVLKITEGSVGVNKEIHVIVPNTTVVKEYNRKSNQYGTDKKISTITIGNQMEVDVANNVLKDGKLTYERIKTVTNPYRICILLS